MNFAKLEKTVWPVFLIWAGVGLIALFLQVDAEMISRQVTQASFQWFLISCLSWGDFLFHVFAAINLLFAVSHYLGWKKTWACFAIVGLISAIVETIGTLTGYPFGSYFYTDKMGPLLAGTLPLAIPLAWWNILSSFYLITRHFLPRLDPRLTCFLVAVFATALDWVMEPFAWQIKGYWLWQHGDIPLQNYAGWFGLSFILCRVCPFYDNRRPSLDKRVIAVPALMLLFFISARLLHGI